MSATAKNMRDAYEVIRALTRIDPEIRHVEIMPLDDPDVLFPEHFYETVRKAHDAKRRR